MTRDFSRLTDEELFRMVGRQPATPVAPAAPAPSRNLSQLSDEELFAIASPDSVGASTVTTPVDNVAPLQKEPSLLERFSQGTGEFAKGAVSGLENVGLGILQTATDLGIDFQGAKSILATIRPDLEREIMSQEVSEILKERVKEKRAAEKEKGIAFKAGKLGGEVAPFLPVGAGLGLIKGGAAAGGTISALAPLEDSGVAQRAQEAATGAALGATVGGLFRGAGAVAGGVQRGIKRLTTATRPEDILAARLPRGETVRLLDELKAAPADSPVILPDIAGDEVVGLTRSIGKLSGGSKDVIREAIEGRSSKAVERVTNQLSKDISDVDIYFGALDDIAKARSTAAAPFYEKAFARKTRLDPRKDAKLLEKIQPDIADARRKFRLGDEIPDNSLVMLDNAKKSLDDKIGAAIRQGENQQARALTGLKNELVDRLDELNPDYKEARKVFSDYATIETAQKEGLEFSKRTPEELIKRFKDFSVGEKEAFRIGVRENLQRIVSKTPEGADPAKRIFGNTLKRNQLKAVFKDEASFKNFEKRMREEIQAADIKFKTLGGSRTDINIANDAQFIEEIAKGGAILGGSKAALLNALVTSLKNRAAGLSQKNAKQLAEILVDRKKGIEALELILQKEQNGVQKRIIGEFIESVRPALITTQTIQTTRER